MSVRALVTELQRLCAIAMTRPYEYLGKWMYRFLARNELSIRRVTRNVSLPASVLQGRRNEFWASINNILRERPATIFLNMDQTAVQFDMPPVTTVHFLGSRSVPIGTRSSTSERITVALCVASTGEKLPPYAVFKGAAQGRIIREFTQTGGAYPQSIVYAVQKKHGWMLYWSLIGSQGNDFINI